jgi:hypothetical protein
VPKNPDGGGAPADRIIYITVDKKYFKNRKN